MFLKHYFYYQFICQKNNIPVHSVVRFILSCCKRVVSTLTTEYHLIIEFTISTLKAYIQNAWMNIFYLKRIQARYIEQV